ncbi:hypothetical protein [Caldalkalibacillus thermarum]|uniref:hypothetical protein n=1 Tax=Caldalkalibacillus thermarum TaxID=296745 RepID=UPI003078A8AB
MGSDLDDVVGRKGHALTGQGDGDRRPPWRASRRARRPEEGWQPPKERQGSARKRGRSSK